MSLKHSRRGTGKVARHVRLHKPDGAGLQAAVRFPAPDRNRIDYALRRETRRPEGRGPRRRHGIILRRKTQENEMAGAEGFELSTCGFGDHRSNQLS